MKEKLEKTKGCIAILLSAFATIAMNMNSDFNTEIEYSFSGNSMLIVIYFVLTYWLLKKVLEIKNKRLKICTAILAIIFASFEIVGSSINTYLNLNEILVNKIAITKSLFRWAGYFIIIYAILTNIFIRLEAKEFFRGKCEWFTNNKRTFFIVWIIIFIAWIPYFLNYYPGVITPDSMGQICQSLGINGLTNHHPVFHTFLIGITMNIGKIIGDYNIGVAIFSLIQMLLASAVYSFTIFYLAKRKVDVKLRVLTLIFYAFYPINALYSITIWKDIPFAICMLIFTIFMTELSTNSEHFMKSKFKNVLLVLSMILVILFRNNGIYVVILTLPFIFILIRNNYKKLVVITCIIFSFYIAWKGPIFSILNVKQGSTREALSIPLQQFARITKNHADTLTDEEKARIYKYLPIENLGDVYYPKISDQVKNHFDDKAFAEDKMGFVKLWVKLCLKYPRAAIESFLCNSYGYWYPEAIHWVVGREVYQSNQEKEQTLQLKDYPIIDLEALEKWDSLLDRRDLPLNSMLYSIGFTFWVVLTMFVYTIYKKQYKMILIYIPICVLWLTCLASPVFGEFRYIYSMFICLPILIGIHFKEKQ